MCEAISGRGWGKRGCMGGSACAWCLSHGTRDMVGQVAGRRPRETVNDIVQDEQLFPLHSLAEDTATRSPEGVLGDLDTAVVQL